MRTYLKLCLLAVLVFNLNCEGEGTGGPGSDLATIESPDMAAPDNGCATMGTQVATAMFACPGAFTKGMAETNCANGWHICTATAMASQTCGTLSGFFISSGFATAVAQDWTNSFCRPPTNNPAEYPVILGCGKLGGGYKHMLTTQCKAFTAIVDCSTSGTPIDCGRQGKTIDDVASALQTDGTLCCK